MQRKFKRNLTSLDEIFVFIGEYFAQEQIDQDHLYAVTFAVEELFTNMLKYNPGNTNDVLLGLEQDNGHLAVSLTDFDVEPFDINKAPEVRIDLPLEARKPGGLGIHLVKKMMDRIDYEYVDRRSTTTLIKKLG